MTSSKGFTIIELIIATTVFSVILLISSYGFLQIARLYTRTVNFNRTQETAHTILEEISQAIQFSGKTISTTAPAPDPPDPIDTPQAVCINGKRFNYRLTKQLTNDSPEDSQTRAALVVEDLSSGCTSREALPLDDPSDPVMGATNPRELLSENMRLEKFVIRRIDPIQDIYELTVVVIYGDEDLLEGTEGDRRCNVRTKGSQYCAVSEFSAIVQKRI